MPRLPAPALVALAAALLLAFLAQRAGAAPWSAPVDGEVARAFTYRGSEPFRAGRHRGADFAARPGTIVRAACAGRVSFAGRVGRQGGVVSVACGPWRVSYLPLRGLAVRAGTRVAPGDPLGRLAVHPAHAGLHLGVRRERSRWGYVDPARFFGATVMPPPVAGRPARGTRPRPPSLGPAPPSVTVSTPRTAPARAPAPAGGRPALSPAPAQAAGWPAAAAPDGAPVAPWPAWLGLGLLLAAAAGAGARRHRRARVRRPVGSAAAATGRSPPA
jgi:hypothetical protein